MASYTLTKTQDHFIGTAGADLFSAAAGTLQGDDLLSGGSGIDTLAFTAAGTVSAADLAGVTGIERFQLAAGGTNAFAMTGEQAAANGHRITVLGGGGSDTIDLSALTAATRADLSAGSGGDDTLIGGAGDDIFRFASGLTLRDLVVGGAGFDMLFTTGGNLGALRGIEQVQLTAAASIGLTDAIVTANGGAPEIVFGDGDDHLDASRLTSTGVRVTAGGGDDVLTGGGGNDRFAFQIGQFDTRDILYGGGADDTLAFTTAGTIGAAALAGVHGFERIVLTAPSTITVDDATLARNNANGRLAIADAWSMDASQLSADHAIDYTAARATAPLLGGLGADTFTITAGAFQLIDGGGGDRIDRLTLVGLATGGTIRGIEEVFARRINLDAATVASAYGGRMTLHSSDAGSALIAEADVTGELTFHGNRSRDELIGGAGNDILYGNDGNDFLNGQGGRDSLYGGAGDDSFYYTPEDAIISGGSGTDSLATVGSPGFRIVVEMARTEDQTVNDDVIVTGIESFDFDGPVDLTGTDAKDVIRGSVFADRLDGAAGHDNIRGNTNFSTAYETYDIALAGGAGNDTLVSIHGGNFDLALANQSLDGHTMVTGFENIGLQSSGTVYGDHRANVLSATVQAVSFYGRGGNDILTGGQNVDILDGGDGDDRIDGYSDADTLTGGAGADVFVARSGKARILDFSGGTGDGDRIQIQGGFDYNGTAFDARLIAGSTATDITGADLLIYTGGTLDTAAQAQGYLAAAAGGSVDEGLFLIGTRRDGDAALFYAYDASFTHSTNVIELVIFDSPIPATAFQLADFLFT